MSVGNSARRGGGFGTRGANPGRTPAATSAPRQLTYAALSIPGADEAPPPRETIVQKIDSFWLRMKYQLVLIAIGCAFMLTQGFLFSGCERTVSGAEKQLGRELKALAAQCQDPAARKRLEDAGWSVHVGTNGSCRVERGRK